MPETEAARPAPQPTAPPSQARPPAVVIACWLLWVQVAAGVLVCALVVTQRDDLGSVWSPMQVGDSTVQPVEFVPVILVLYGVTAVLSATLIALFMAGHNWARHALAAIVAGVIVVAVATVRTDPPPMVDGIAIGAAVISAVTLVFLWHPQSRQFARDAGRSSAADS
jgi:O-antigen/teichoic acid export membrane protein